MLQPEFLRPCALCHPQPWRRPWHPWPISTAEVAGLDRAKVDQLCLDAKGADPSPDPQCQAWLSADFDERFQMIRTNSETSLVTPVFHRCSRKMKSLFQVARGKIMEWSCWQTEVANFLFPSGFTCVWCLIKNPETQSELCNHWRLYLLLLLAFAATLKVWPSFIVSGLASLRAVFGILAFGFASDSW